MISEKIIGRGILSVKILLNFQYVIDSEALLSPTKLFLIYNLIDKNWSRNFSYIYRDLIELVNTKYNSNW